MPKKLGVEKGFTLIEMLVAISILAMFTVVTIRYSGDFIGSASTESILEKEVQQFLNLAVYAEDKAVLAGDPIGLVIEPPEIEPIWSYHWKHYRGGEWVGSEDPLLAHQLPDNVEVAMVIEGEEIDFTKVPVEDEETEIRLPVIIFYPGGEITPFRFTLYDNTDFDQQVFMTNERIGRVEQLDSEEELYAFFN